MSRRMRAALQGKEDLKALLSHLEASGHSAHIVGGSVRDTLLGREVKDFDISTSAHPNRVIDLFSPLYPVHPTGIEHGTVTVVINHEPYEITTWRRDVETDGRRAVVAFAQTIEEDAVRRDFTINALYADSAGRILDPSSQGREDIDGKVLRFIGDPINRIEEDALRILRFFRFYASIEGAQMDQASLEACASKVQLIDGLSRERIGSEMRKIVMGDNAARSIDMMRSAGIFEHVLPGEQMDIESASGIFETIKDACGVLSIQRTPEMIFSALFDRTPKEEFRLSRQSASLIETLKSWSSGDASSAELGYRLGVDRGLACLVLRHIKGETHTPLLDEAEALYHGAAQSFPLKARDLPKTLTGPDIGQELRRREASWIAAGFRLEETPLLLPDQETGPPSASF